MMSSQNTLVMSPIWTANSVRCATDATSPVLVTVWMHMSAQKNQRKMACSTRPTAARFLKALTDRARTTTNEKAAATTSPVARECQPCEQVPEGREQRARD